MNNQLFVSLYNDPTFTGTTDPVETHADAANIGARWTIQGGVQRIEFTINAKSRVDAWRRYQDHLGWRVAVYDGRMDYFLGGVVREVQPSPDFRKIKYVCTGNHKRAGESRYLNGDFPATGNTDAIVKDIITDRIPIVSSDYSNIASTGLAVGGWTPNPPMEYKSQECIDQLAAMGNSSQDSLDFYYVDGPFDRSHIGKPVAYLQKRNPSGLLDWQFWQRDLAPAGNTLSRNIHDLRRKIYIGHGRINGTDDGTGTRMDLSDSTASFFSVGISIGDRLINVTQNKVFSVDTILTATTIRPNDQSTATNFTNGDKYTIDLKYPKWATPGFSTLTDLWAQFYSEARMEMDSTQANNYGTMMRNQYETPQQRQAFVLTTPYIVDGVGSMHHPIRALMGDSFNFRFNDFYPDQGVFADLDDRSLSFTAVAMDYEHNTGRLRIVPSTGDSRLDVLIQQALKQEKEINQIISAE